MNLNKLSKHFEQDTLTEQDLKSPQGEAGRLL